MYKLYSSRKLMNNKEINMLNKIKSILNPKIFFFKHQVKFFQMNANVAIAMASYMY